MAGARAIGLSRSAGKRERLLALGLAAALDPACDDLARRIVDATAAAAWTSCSTSWAERG